MKRLILLFVIIFPLGIYGQTYLGSFGAIQEIEPLGDRVFFTANGNMHGSELWVTNGTERGTFMVKDINPTGGSGPGQLTLFNDELYFTASDNRSKADLWKTDGTNSGTKKVYEVSYRGINDLTVVGNDLFFIRGYRLQKFNANTNEVKEIDVDDYYFLES